MWEIVLAKVADTRRNRSSSLSSDKLCNTRQFGTCFFAEEYEESIH